MKLGMVIDLQKCVGCGGCNLACKTENNTPEGVAWSHHISQTTGKFPDVNYSYVPTMCNHCDNAACVEVCPKDAMYKADNGLTLHDIDKCIGCRRCERACPYKVISFNKGAPHRNWQDDTPLLEGATSSPKEVLQITGAKNSPTENPERGDTYAVTRPRRTIEKCTMCDHRQNVGLKPACVEACPSGARVVGDLSNPDSEVSRLIRMHQGRPLMPEAGTKPNVYYIRSFGVRAS
ncbi:arsenate respiratory reductase iron-sulfur subunit ArrB [Paraferrimonas sedimenticola]|uniref:4Fe-4S ferredoxin n=1 Tax=Paraferrimonas sedimenticola TaxID=375674 RepID=A0AA37RRJ0_9GAMM|nr:arsenate respiratory reductase iron-sulfur subunit ArrB [Paraferrimonas sedimenticola]GLP95026.1 4Fe-4S ferredoxin [Paraferrimonas sedimenticola]